jgi:hypothetical protein
VKTHTVIERTENAKLTANPRENPFIATWQSKATCPNSCPWLERCYPNNGPARIHWSKLDGDPAAEQFGNDVLGAILRSKLTRPRVRLSTAGDLTPAMLRATHKAVSAALKHGKTPVVIGYTHNWRKLNVKHAVIPGVMRLRASVDSIAEKIEAERAGWSTAVTLAPDHAPGTHKALRGAGGRFAKSGQQTLVCPEQTGDKIDCFGCMQCVKANHSIGFRIHGSMAKTEKGAK